MILRFAGKLGFVWLLASLLAGGQTAVQLKTSDTSLQLLAGSAAPTLVSIESTGGAWKNQSPDRLIDSVYVDGRAVPVHWQAKPAAATVDSRHVVFVYENDSPRLRLSWAWDARADFGPIEHQIRIENLGDQEIWLPLQDSFQFNFKIDPRTELEQLFVEKGAGTPSNVGTHRVPLIDGYKWRGTSSTYAHPKDDEPREIIPWFLVQNKSSAQDGWYVGIEFSGRTQLSVQREGDSLKGSGGLNPDPAPFRTRLRPGESFETPTIFLGAFGGGPDAAGRRRPG